MINTQINLPGAISMSTREIIHQSLRHRKVESLLKFYRRFFQLFWLYKLKSHQKVFGKQIKISPAAWGIFFSSLVAKDEILARTKVVRSSWRSISCSIGTHSRSRYSQHSFISFSSQPAAIWYQQKVWQKFWKPCSLKTTD